MSFASSFTVDTTSAAFDITETSFADKAGPLEEVTAKLVIADDTSWGALFSLRSWNVNVRPIPKRVGVASKVLVQVGGGAGQGTLAIDTWSDIKTAILTALTGEAPEVGGGRRVASATFLITGVA